MYIYICFCLTCYVSYCVQKRLVLPAPVEFHPSTTHLVEPTAAKAPKDERSLEASAVGARVYLVNYLRMCLDVVWVQTIYVDSVMFVDGLPKSMSWLFPSARRFGDSGNNDVDTYLGTSVRTRKRASLRNIRSFSVQHGFTSQTTTPLFQVGTSIRFDGNGPGGSPELKNPSTFLKRT